MSQHLEGMGDKWYTLLESPQLVPAVLHRTVDEGGTRSQWRVEKGNTETMLLAWPEVSLLRSAVLVTGEIAGELRPVNVFPLMEGLPNNMVIEGTYTWKNGMEGEVAAYPIDLAAAEDDEEEIENAPLWFYDPLFFRDNEVDLTPGVIQGFFLSGLCYDVRKALLDEMTITKGPQYEEYAAEWLAQNPGKKSYEVPPLKISLEGLRVLGPAQHLCEYQARATIMDLDSFTFGPEGAEEKIYRFICTLGSEKSPIHVLMFAPEAVCHNGYEPKEGDAIDTIFWLQGRVIDAMPADYAEAPQAQEEVPQQ